MTLYAQLTQAFDAIETYPITYAQLRAANPGVMFPRSPTGDILEQIKATYRIVDVAEMPQPDHDAIDENVAEVAPAFNADLSRWEQAWSVVPASAEQIAKRQAIADDVTSLNAAKADAFVRNFISMSPAQVATYIETNVTDLASVRNIMQKMALMMHHTARRAFRDVN